MQPASTSPLQSAPYLPQMMNEYNAPLMTKTQCLVLFTGGLALVTLLCAAVGIPFIVVFQPVPSTKISAIVLTETTTTTVGPLRWNRTGETVFGVLGMNTTTPFYLGMPNGMVFDSTGALYIADSTKNRVQKIILGQVNGSTVAGDTNGNSGSSGTHLSYPNDVAIDQNDNLYIVDTSNHRVQLWYVNAISGIKIAGSGISGNLISQLDTPRGIALNPNTGDFYIADSMNHRIMKYSLNSSVGTLVLGGQGAGVNRSQLYMPIGLYYDSVSDSLIIANRGAHNIVRWSPGATQWIPVAGDPNGLSGVSNTKLKNPWDVTVDSFGNVYVADTGNERIQFFPAGQSNGTTIAGMNGVSGINATLLSSPYSIALDRQLNIYVSDMDNNRIQKFTRY